MIVLITHQSPEILEKCLETYFNFETEKHEILVCETSYNFDSQYVAQKYNVPFVCTGPYYEAGAINYVFQNHSATEYFFFQDSIEFMCFEWEKIFRIPSQGFKCVGMSTFPINHDHIDTITAREWYKAVTGNEYDWSTDPIFGNMFYCPRTIKETLEANRCASFSPTSKLESCAMERIWSALLPKYLLVFTSDYTNDFWGWQHYIKKIWNARS